MPARGDDPRGSEQCVREGSSDEWAAAAQPMERIVAISGGAMRPADFAIWDESTVKMMHCKVAPMVPHVRNRT
jgi:hypothetical protein